jgi:ubiquitin-protein ligase
MVGDNLFHWKATIKGAVSPKALNPQQDSPYESGKFLIDIVIPNAYPYQPPKVTPPQLLLTD